MRARTIENFDTRKLPMLPPEYQARAPQSGDVLPDTVVYIVGGGLAPAIPNDPDQVRAVVVSTPMTRCRLANGLTPRSDCMARLMARGVSGADAYRAAYNAPAGLVVASKRASVIAGSDRFKSILLGYRQSLAKGRQQSAFNVRDFVLSRLTLEAQNAPNAASRIRALELLGKSEAMFASVNRVEKTIDPASLASLKAQLEQRLRGALSRLDPSNGSSLGPMNERSFIVDEGNTDSPEPHPSGSPLIGLGPHVPEKYIEPLKRSLDSSSLDSSSLDSPSMDSFVDSPSPYNSSPDSNSLGPITEISAGGYFPIGTPIQMCLGDISISSSLGDEFGKASPRELTLADLGL